MLPPRRIFLVLLCIAAPAGWSSAGEFELVRSTVDAGGQRSAGPTLSVTGTMGQSEVAQAQSSSFALVGGFWKTLPAADPALFSNGFE